MHEAGVLELGAPGRLTPGEFQAYTDIAKKAAQELGLDSGETMLLLGSIAEGISNPGSDVDIYAIRDGAEGPISPRHLLWLNGRRVEIFERTVGDITKLADATLRAANGNPITLSRESASEYQRFCNGIVLVETAVTERVLALRQPSAVTKVITERARALAEAFAIQCKLFLALGDLERATRKAHRAVLHAGKCWAAAHGETFVADKFLGLQLARLGMGGLAPAIMSLIDEVRSDEAYVESCLAVAAEATGIDVEAPVIRAQPQPDLSSIEVNGRYYFSLGERLFIADGDAHEFVDNLIEEKRDLSIEEISALSEILLPLSACGLIRFEHPETGNLLWENRSAPPAERPVIEPFGPIAARSTAKVSEAGVSLRRVAGACGEMFWQQLLIDNDWEDFEGAASVAHWPVVQAALRHQARVLASVLLCGAGSYPLPADEDTVLACLDIPFVTRECKQLLLRAEYVRVSDAAEAEAAARLLREAYDALPEEVRADYLRGSHDDKAGQLRLLETSGWLDIASRIGTKIDNLSELDFGDGNG